MEIVTAATRWAKGEITASKYFMLFGIGYIIMAIAFWQLGHTPLIGALFIPMLVAGGLLLSAGLGFYFSNKTKLLNFETDYKADPAHMINAELATTSKTIKTYENIALKVFPAIIVVAAVVVFLVSSPMIRAIGIGLIAFLSVLVLLDSQALKRMKDYHQQLELAKDSM